MSASLEYAAVFQGLLAVWVGLRSYRTYQGRPYSAGRVFLFPLLVLIVYATTEFETVATVSWAYPLWTTADLVVLAVAAMATIPLAGRLVRVSQRPDGTWYYQYGIELITVYLALWVVRLGLAVVYDPASLGFAAPTGPPLSATASAVVVLIQGLFSVSSGLVIGRAIGTYTLHLQAVAKARSQPVHAS
jgi:hypothetical protein